MKNSRTIWIIVLVAVLLVAGIAWAALAGDFPSPREQQDVTHTGSGGVEPIGMQLVSTEVERRVLPSRSDQRRIEFRGRFNRDRISTARMANSDGLFCYHAWGAVQGRYKGTSLVFYTVRNDVRYCWTPTRGVFDVRWSNARIDKAWWTAWSLKRVEYYPDKNGGGQNRERAYRRIETNWELCATGSLGVVCVNRTPYVWVNVARDGEVTWDWGPK